MIAGVFSRQFCLLQYFGGVKLTSGLIAFTSAEQDLPKYKNREFLRSCSLFFLG